MCLIHTQQQKEMNLTNVKRILVAFAVAATTLVGLGAAPASASYATCPSGVSCLYTGQNGAGTQRNLAFSSWGPPGTCRNITFYPVGGYHSAKGGYGSGYALVVYGGAGCTNYLATLENGQTMSSAFNTIRSIMIT